MQKKSKSDNKGRINSVAYIEGAANRFEAFGFGTDHSR